MHEEDKLDTQENGYINRETSSPVIMLRSELAQEIISRRSGFVENWALPIFLMILVTIFAGSWFVHYPDSINATATINAESGPMRITSPKDAILKKLLVKDGQLVKRNSIICWLESATDHKQVITLLTQVDKAIDFLGKNNKLEATKAISQSFDSLGDIQPAYQEFLNKSSQSKDSYKGHLQTLRYTLTEWMKNYTIVAPLEGKVSFSSPINEGKYLSNGSLLGFIIPNNDNYYAEASITQNNLAKIDTGMIVQLKLDAYPYQDWGMLKGKVNSISKVLNQGAFTITINLTPDLTTTDNKNITLRNGLTAEATIISKDVRLFHKFYHSFISSTSLDK